MNQLEEYKMFVIMLTNMFTPEEFLDRVNKIPLEHRHSAKVLITKVLINAVMQGKEKTNN